MGSQFDPSLAQRSAPLTREELVQLAARIKAQDEAHAAERRMDWARFDVHQVRFVNLIVDELTANGIVDPGRLFESPYTDYAPTGPDGLFEEDEVDSIVDILREVDERSEPLGA